MILTAEKIAVTDRMMSDAGMTRMTKEGFEYGVPINPFNPSDGLSWKLLWDLKDEHFDKIEEYFLTKATT